MSCKLSVVQVMCESQKVWMTERAEQHAMTLGDIY